MNALILYWGLTMALWVFAGSSALACLRVILGPKAEDRIMALDLMYLTAMLMILCLGIRSGTALYFDVALLIALFGFVSSAALAKFLLKGEVIEP